DAELHLIEGLPLLTLPTTTRLRSRGLVKRAVDVVLAAFGLLVLAPYFGYAAVRIKLDSPGPVFCRQTRLGRTRQPFRLVKFRTMMADADDRQGGGGAGKDRTAGVC